MSILLSNLFIMYSLQYGLPENLLSSLCYVESKHDINAYHKDDGKGNSVGVCQIKRSSAADMGFLGSESQLLDPKNNIKYAALFLKYQLKRYNGNIPRAVTAYNKGKSTGTGYSIYYNKVLSIWSKHDTIRISYAKNP